MCERNTGYESGTINAFLHEVDYELFGERTPSRCVSVRQKKDRDFGWWTTNEIKMSYASSAQAALGTRSVRFMEGWACGSLHHTVAHLPKDTVRERMKTELLIQLNNVRVFNKEGTTPLTTKKTTISGKVDETGKVREGQNDDMFIVLGMAPFFMRMHMNRALPNFNYREFWGSL